MDFVLKGINMQEGWRGKDYLVLFDEAEITDITQRYDLAGYISGYSVVGLKGWDDFILRNVQGQIFTIPTVPIDARYLAPSDQSIATQGLVSDERVKGKIKWYTNPIIFGGNPNSPENICWINLDQHTQAVKWFNELYRTMTQK